MNIKHLNSIFIGASVFALIPSLAIAQDEQEESDDVITVTGSSFQRALSDALAEKRNAPNVIEAVSSEDIGKLPEISIAESLARLPGLATNRDRGNGTEISIRGLGPNLSNTLLNGREVVSGEESRNVRYEQYPGELLTGAYVYKSPTARQVEGGIGGTVDLRTIRPLDYDDRRLVTNFRGSYFDIADDIDDADTLGYTLSVSYVDQFMDDTLGLALGYARREQPIATARTNIFPSENSFADLDGDGETFPFPDGNGDAIPFGFEGLIRGGEDVRDGILTAVQWLPNDTWEANFDFFYSTFDFREEQRGFRAENLAFGNFFDNISGEDGFITGIDVTRDVNAGFDGLVVETVNEEFTFVDDLYATGLNLKRQAGNLTLEGDIGYSTTTRDSRFITVRSETRTLLDGSGPQAGFRSTGGGDPATYNFNFDLSDPAINIPAVMEIPTADEIEDTLFSTKFDATYEFDQGFFTAVKGGVRLTDREKSLEAGYQFLENTSGAPVPADLLGDPLTGFGSFGDLPLIITFDRGAVISELFGEINTNTTDPFYLTESWVVEEDITAAYAQVDFANDGFAIPFSGNLGVRYIQTDTTSSSTRLNNVDGNVETEPFTIENDFTDVLPSLNLAFDITDNQKIRFAAAKAIARAPLDDLRAGVGEFDFGNPEAFGGNPTLEPFRTNQIDLTYEWYITDDSALTISGFYKDVETYIVRATRQDTELPSGAIGDFTQPINGEGGYLQGYEISYQTPFDFLPGFLSDFGFYGNFTYVDSDIEVDPAFVTGSYPLPGLSPETTNLQLWYYNSGFEARLGYRNRAEFATELGDVPNQVLFNDSEEIYDFQMSYEFQPGTSIEGLQVLFQANNLTNEAFETYYGTPSARGRYEEFGTRYWFGFSYEY